VGSGRSSRRRGPWGGSMSWSEAFDVVNPTDRQLTASGVARVRCAVTRNLLHAAEMTSGDPFQHQLTMTENRGVPDQCPGSPARRGCNLPRIVGTFALRSRRVELPGRVQRGARQWPPARSNARGSMHVAAFCRRLSVPPRCDRMRPSPHRARNCGFQALG
jgi:hypothetical protein